MRARELGRPKGARWYRCPGGNAQTQVIQVRPERRGLILRLLKKHNQLLLVTFWMMRQEGEGQGLGIDPALRLSQSGSRCPSC